MYECFYDYLLCDKYGRAYTYTLIDGPDNLAVSLSTIKEHLRLDASDSSQDTYLTLLVQSVILFAEEYTKRDFITKTYKTFRDIFFSYFLLRKSKLQSITSIKYYVDDVLQTLSTDVYYNTLEDDYSKILLKEDQVWPTDIDQRLQAIEIIFDCGYGDTDSSIPSDLKLALLNHIAFVYENRGDCTNIKDNLPVTSKLIYDKYRIIDIHGRLYN